MIVYSVTVNVDDSIAEDWLNWMKGTHIPDVMKTGFFLQYRLLKVIGHAADETGVTFNIQYDCSNMKDLHEYQAHHSPKLQQDHNDRYAGKFAAFRNLLEQA